MLGCHDNEEIRTHRLIRLRMTSTQSAMASTLPDLSLLRVDGCTGAPEERKRKERPEGVEMSVEEDERGDAPAVRCMNLHRHTQSGGTCWITSVRTLILQFDSLVKVLYAERRDERDERDEHDETLEEVRLVLKLSTTDFNKNDEARYRELATANARRGTSVTQRYRQILGKYDDSGELELLSREEGGSSYFLFWCVTTLVTDDSFWCVSATTKLLAFNSTLAYPGRGGERSAREDRAQDRAFARSFRLALRNEPDPNDSDPNDRNDATLSILRTPLIVPTGCLTVKIPFGSSMEAKDGGPDMEKILTKWQSLTNLLSADDFGIGKPVGGLIAFDAHVIPFVQCRSRSRREGTRYVTCGTWQGSKCVYLTGRDTFGMYGDLIGQYDYSDIEMVWVMYDLEAAGAGQSTDDATRWTRVRSFFRKFRKEESDSDRLETWLDVW
mgnify:CR=1 FL=1